VNLLREDLPALASFDSGSAWLQIISMKA